MVGRAQSMQVLLLSDGSDPKEYDEERGEVALSSPQSNRARAEADFERTIVRE